VCGYHGWAYDTRGRLRRAPRVKGIRNFKASEWGLRRVPLETWGPFVFLWLGGGGGGGGGAGCGGCGGGGSEGAESGGGSAGGGEGARPPLEEWLGARLGRAVRSRGGSGLRRSRSEQSAERAAGAGPRSGGQCSRRAP
jgi:hypothetical protein